MCGVLPHSSSDTGKLVRFGYVTITAGHDGLLGPEGTQLRTHEFHYWDSTNCGESWKAVKTSGKEYRCGHEEGALVAGYPHLYYYSNPEVAYRFLLKCSRYGN